MTRMTTRCSATILAVAHLLASAAPRANAINDPGPSHAEAASVQPEPAEASPKLAGDTASNAEAAIDVVASASATFDPNGPFDNDGIVKLDAGPGDAELSADDMPPETNDQAPAEPGEPDPRGGTPPPNDACSSGTVIPGNVAIYNPPLLNTTGATNAPCEAGEACEAGGAGTSNSVWYSYTPALSGRVEINTFGSNYNTVLSVWPGCGGGTPPFCLFPTQIACNDDASFGTQSQLFLDVVAGSTYRIKVSDYNLADGGGILNFNLLWYPPNDQCADATVIYGVAHDAPAYPTQAAVTELCENQESCEVNNVGVSNTVWYSYVAPCDGLISLNTNGSTYDTVLSVFDKCGFFYAVDFPCNFGETAPVQLACDDDSGTGVNSQILDLPVIGGETYLIKVSDYNTSSGGGLLDFNFVFSGSETPVAAITSPSALECVCGVVEVTGSAHAGAGPVVRTLEYQLTGASSWELISSATTPVNAGLLGSWNTTGLAQGYYVLRLTVQNACGMTETAVALAFVDATFDTFDLRAPLDGALVGGTTCIDGTVWDRCFDSYTVDYRPAGVGAFTPVDPTNPAYPAPVINDPLAGPGWNTTALADGDYELRIEGLDQCGHSAAATLTVTVDNTPPVAEITSPLSCSLVGDAVEIIGTADDAHLAGWALQYTGGDENGWVTIASDDTPVIDGVLAVWNTGELPACAYTLRLIATDATPLNCGPLRAQAEYTVTVDLGTATSCCDINHDGNSDGLDVAPFVNCILNGVCP